MMAFISWSVSTYLFIGLLSALKESYYNVIADEKLPSVFARSVFLWPRDAWEDIRIFIERVT